MFSRLFSAEPPEANPLWSALSRRKAAGEAVLDLTVSNPTEAGLPYPSDLPAYLARPGVLRYRPDPRGHRPAREAIAAYLGRQAGSTFDAEDLLLTASTSEAYSFLFKLLCDPGDEALIPAPTYPLFDSLAALDRVELVRYPLRPREAPPDGPSRWAPDFAFLRNMVSTRTKALILVSPNNPTGHVADAGERAAYLELARDYGLALIVDEVFSDYLFGGTYAPFRSDGPLVFTLNGLSKLAGLPQLKLGWIHATGDRARVREAMGHLEWIADAYLSVNTPVQLACEDLLARAPALRAPIRARLEANLAAARRLPDTVMSRLHPLFPEGGWSLALRASLPPGRVLDDESLALGLLEDRGVHLYPGALFGFGEEPDQAHLVASLLTPEDDFREGLARLSAHLETLHG